MIDVPSLAVLRARILAQRAERIAGGGGSIESERILQINAEHDTWK